MRRTLVPLLAAFLYLAHRLPSAAAADSPTPFPQSHTDLYGDPIPEGAAMRLGTGRLRNAEGSLAVVFSPDGKYLATGGFDGIVKVWEFPAGRLHRQLDCRMTVQGLAYSPDGRELAVSGGRWVSVFDTDTGKEKQKLRHEARGNGLYGLAFAPDGQTLASGGNDSVVRIWDLSTGSEAHSFTVPGPGVRDQFALAYSMDGTLLAAGYASAIVIIDLRTKKPRATIPAHTHQTVSLAFTANGEQMVSGGFAERIGGAEICVWNTADGSLARKLSPDSPKRTYCSLALSSDGKTLVSGHFDGLLIWDFPEAKVRHSIDTNLLNGLRTHGVAISPRGDAVAAISGNTDNRIRVWQTKGAAPLLDFTDSHVGNVLDVTWSPDGRELYSTSYDRSIRRWDVKSARQLEVMTCGERVVSRLLIARESNTLIAAGGILNIDAPRPHGLLRFVDLGTNKSLEEAFPNSRIWSAALSSDGTRLAVAGGLGREWDDTERDPVIVSVWDVATRKQLGELKGHTQPVVGLRFSADGKYLASAARDGSVRRWDIANRRLSSAKVLKETVRNPATHEAITRPVHFRSIGLTADLAAAIAGGSQGSLSIRRLEPGGNDILVQHPDYEWSEGRIALSPDGKLAAIGGGRRIPQVEHLVLLFDATSGKVLHEFHPDEFPYGLDFSLEGTRLACGTNIGTILIYDLPESVLRHE